MKITFKSRIQKFKKKGEKSGWTYIEISKALAEKLKPENKKSFRVKGKLDAFEFSKQALLPMGDGNFIMALNAVMRKEIKKAEGDMVQVMMEEDKREIALSAELIACLKDEPSAWEFFNTLTKGHQQYFSKWVESAKTTPTKTKRIVMAVNALARKLGFPEMLREQKGRNN